jgi:hypothetical protein
LEETSKALGWHQAAAVFAAASVREISLTSAKPLTVLSKVYAAADTPGAKDALPQAEALLNADRRSPVNQRLLIDARLTRAEAAPPESRSTPTELQQMEPLLAHADSYSRFRLKQALGRSLAATGDDDAAMQSFREAITAQERGLPSVKDPLVRIIRTETLTPAYIGLLNIQLAKKHDLPGALTTWDRYRNASIKSPPENLSKQTVTRQRCASCMLLCPLERRSLRFDRIPSSAKS